MEGFQHFDGAAFLSACPSDRTAEAFGTAIMDDAAFREANMARARQQGNGRLEEAIAILIQNQAQFLARVAEIDARIAETNRVNAERFARIEAILMEHTRILNDHGRILRALPDAIRKKIGFKTPEQQNPPG
jgi:hypothetical protein